MIQEELKKVLTDQNEVIEGSKKFEETTKFVIGGLKEQVKNLDKERKKLLEEGFLTKQPSVHKTNLQFSSQ